MVDGRRAERLAYGTTKERSVFSGGMLLTIRYSAISSSLLDAGAAGGTNRTGLKWLFRPQWVLTSVPLGSSRSSLPGRCILMTCHLGCPDRRNGSLT